MTDTLVVCHYKWIALEPADEDDIIWLPEDARREELVLNMALTGKEELMTGSKKLSPIFMLPSRDDLGLEGIEIVAMKEPELVEFGPYRLLLVSGYGLTLKHTTLIFRLPNVTQDILNNENKCEKMLDELTTLVTFELELDNWKFMESGTEDVSCELIQKVPGDYTTMLFFH